MNFTYSKLNGTGLLWERMRTAWSKNCLRKSSRQIFIGEDQIFIGELLIAGEEIRLLL